MKHKILIFENDNDVAERLSKNLKRDGFVVAKVNSPVSFPSNNEDLNAIDLFIIDLMMGDLDLPKELQDKTEKGLLTGFIVYKFFVLDNGPSACKETPVIFLTGLNDEAMIDSIKKQVKSCETLKKPVDHDVILQKIKGFLK